MKEFEIAVFDELEPLYPDSKVECGNEKIYLAGANGGYVGGHILIKNLEIGQFLSLAVETNSKNKYKFFELIDVPVEINTGFSERTEFLENKINDNVIRRAPFMVYEVLKPFYNIIKIKSNTMAVAFRIKIECDEHITEKFKVNISYKNEIKSIDCVLEQFPVDIPIADKNQHKYINWFCNSEIESIYGVENFTKPWEDIWKKHLKLAAYGRQNMACFWPALYFDLVDGFPKLNKQKLDILIKMCDECGINYISGGSITARKDGQWDATQVEINGFKDFILNGNGESVLYNMASELNEYIINNKLEDRWIQSVMDEPIRPSSEVYKLSCSIIKKAMPNIPILEATIASEGITGTVDIWCPTVDEYEKQKEFFDKRCEVGDRLFVYTCLKPAGNYCNRLLDMERLRQVWIGWAPIKYPKIEGFLHWGGNWYRGGNPYEQSIPFNKTDIPRACDYDINQAMLLPVGDNAIVYPYGKEPLSTIRLEAHRIGFEDLTLLQQLPKSKAQNIVNKVFRGYSDFEKSVKKYREVKKEILETLYKSK